ncbi:MAG: hypothetical protein AAB638_01910 [Patescibacteria group bacterium]
MNRYLVTFIFSVCFFSVLSWSVSAQDSPILTATLHNETSPAQTLSAGAQGFDVARITLTATVADVYINGIYLTTDISGGLSNFTDIYLYDVTSGSTLKGTYPNQSANPNLVQFGNVIIGNGSTPKTYLIRASLSSSASGNVRLGFGGFTYPTLAEPVLNGIPIYGNTLTLPGTIVLTPSPTPTPTPSLIPTPIITIAPTPTSLGFTSLGALGLSEGNTISAVGSNDPDIYIVNDWGYKRLFMNPIILNFYGHLGGFPNVKNIVPSTRNTLVTSGLFRNCEINDQRVYGLEVTSEDTGTLHWVNTTGTQAVLDDPDFFKKVFCINTNEFNWYPKDLDYNSVSQVPSYFR